MKSPVYETSAGALEALLETGQFIEAFHYSYTLADGTVLRFSAFDADVTYGGLTWPAGAPKHDVAPSAGWRSGLDVDQWVYNVYPRLVDAISGATFPDLLEGVPWGEAVRNGILDGAVVEVRCAYAGTSPTDPTAKFGTVIPTGVLTHFKGRVAAIDDMKSSLSISLNDFRELLNVSFPRNLFGPACRFVLFDSGCQLVASSFKKSGSVASAPSKSAFVSSTVGSPTGGFSTWAQGRVIFTSGANSGFARAVRSWDSGTGTFNLIAPLPYSPLAGDAFDAYPGCDKTLATCTGAGNQANYGGQDRIPPPETAI